MSASISTENLTNGGDGAGPLPHPHGPYPLTGPVPRTTGTLPLRGDLAHIALAGRCFVPHYAVPQPRVVMPGGAPLFSAPGDGGEELCTLMEGDSFEVLEVVGGWAWGCLSLEGPVGYIRTDRLEALGLMAHTIFIDGAVGTTGLEIAERLAGRPEFRLLVLDEARRKEEAARAEALNSADIAILCLPDDAARAAVAMIRPHSDTRVIDASSAHRTEAGWIYGFPELIGREAVAGATRVSNPGCYPTGFLALVAPLVREGLIPADWPLSVHAVSGYSGGGKALIERFEDDRDIAWRGYGLSGGHKHLPEMQVIAGLEWPPVFSPAVVPAHRGMVVEVPLALAALPGAPSPAALHEVLAAHYAGSSVVQVREAEGQELLLRRSIEGSDRLDLFVFGSADGAQARLVAVLDNLGKGASGAAIQSLNLMTGCEETAGLRL